jgi:hypothetical protein
MTIGRAFHNLTAAAEDGGLVNGGGSSGLIWVLRGSRDRCVTAKSLAQNRSPPTAESAGYPYPMKVGFFPGRTRAARRLKRGLVPDPNDQKKGSFTQRSISSRHREKVRQPHRRWVKNPKRLLNETLLHHVFLAYCCSIGFIFTALRASSIASCLAFSLDPARLWCHQHGSWLVAGSEMKPLCSTNGEPGAEVRAPLQSTLYQVMVPAKPVPFGFVYALAEVTLALSEELL